MLLAFPYGNLNYHYSHRVAHEQSRSASRCGMAQMFNKPMRLCSLFETESYEVENYNFVNQEESLREKQEALGRHWTG